MPAASSISRDSRRVPLAGGAGTTVHIVRYPLESLRLAVVLIAPEAPLETWCAERGIDEAVSGGYATKPEYEPLGALAIDGHGVPHRPFRTPWDTRRAALARVDGRLAIDRLDRLPEAAEDLLQAGPLLVRDGVDVVSGSSDPEGFSSTCDEFDQDLTADRLPRLAIGLTPDALVAVAVDGRSEDDAGMLLGELARLLVELGAVNALNLDGGSAATLVSGGRRRNTPRDEDGNTLEESSPSVSAFVLGRRADPADPAEGGRR